MTNAEFLDAIRTLRVNTEPPVKPYKPVLLCAVVILIHKGVIRSRDIYLDGALKSVFFQVFDLLYPRWPSKSRPKPYDPFRALHSDGIWQLIPQHTQADRLHQDLARGVWHVLGMVRCAQLHPGIFAALAGNAAFRIQVLEVLSKTYLPAGALPHLLKLLGPDAASQTLQANLSERAVEEALERHWPRTNLARQEGIRLADHDVDHIHHRQVMTPLNCIDLLGYQEARRLWWVFELKYQDASSDAVGQVLRYVHHVRNDHARRSEDVVGAILTDQVTPKLTAAAQEGRVQVWSYIPDAVLSGKPSLLRAA
jgi:hypothetical protein